MNFTFAKCTSPYLAFLHRDTLSGKILVAFTPSNFRPVMYARDNVARREF